MKRTAISFLVLVLVASPVWAQFAEVVEDPLNLVQNTFSAIRNLQSNVNEVTQINNQIRSLANEAKNLLTLPTSIVNQIQASFNDYYSLLQQGRGLAYQVQASASQFDQIFSSGGIKGSQALMQKLSTLLGQVREAGRTAAQAQSVFDRLCNQQTSTVGLLAASQAAVGELQATQATNQLLGILADQNASLQQVTAATGRLQLSVYMQDQVRQELSQANMQGWLGSWPTGGFKGVGEGQGKPFPQ